MSDETRAGRRSETSEGASKPLADRRGGSGLHERLAGSSTYFARSAVGAYSSESWELFYLHMATAIEQLVKAVLARAHPSLIADSRANFDSLLHLCGLGDRARVPDFVAAVRTVSAMEAMQRVERLVDNYRPPGPHVQLLLEIRNGIVHSGELARSQSEAMLGEVGGYVDVLLPSLGLTRRGYWGDSTELVEEHTQRRLTAVEATYRRRIAAAKERYRRTIEPMDRPARAAYVAALIPTAFSEDFDEVEVKCPACDKSAVLSGYPEPQWEADWDSEGGEAYVSGAYVKAIEIQGTSFSCRVCGLSLDSTLLGFAGLDAVTLTDDDIDLSLATEHFEIDAMADDEW